MERGITAKFEQNEHLLVDLFRTKGILLAEASPRDRIWGIGKEKKFEEIFSHSSEFYW